eukprot:2757508-Rhodomonas_salina.1
MAGVCPAWPTWLRLGTGMGMAIRVYCAKSGTGLAYGGMRCEKLIDGAVVRCRVMRGSEVASGSSVWWYAMRGTDVATELAHGGYQDAKGQEQLEKARREVQRSAEVEGRERRRGRCCLWYGGSEVEVMPSTGTAWGAVRCAVRKQMVWWCAMRGTETSYARAVRCSEKGGGCLCARSVRSVPRYRPSACYAVPSTERVGLYACVMPGTDTAYGPACLRAYYAPVH